MHWDDCPSNGVGWCVHIRHLQISEWTLLNMGSRQQNMGSKTASWLLYLCPQLAPGIDRKGKKDENHLFLMVLIQYCS